MYLTVTVDTEEDNWGEFTRSDYTVENLGRLPKIHDLFVGYGVRPTYLISYPVATSAAGIDILAGYRARGECEIGAHPHPCNTPPFEEERTEINSYICNLPSVLQFKKIDALTRTIHLNFGIRPTTYRSGRWGFSEEVARNLIRLGYTVDTSVFPVWNWSPGPDFRHYSHEPFVYVMESISAGRSSLLEIPATVDFLQSPESFAAKIFHTIEEVPFGPKILGAMNRMQFLNRVCLSPEVADVREMIRLANTLTDRGTRVLNLFFHSPTLLEGCSPFARTPGDVEAFITRIDSFLRFAIAAGFKPVTTSELTACNLGASRVRELTSVGVA
jgi:hypothetical protein